MKKDIKIQFTMQEWLNHSLYFLIKRLTNLVDVSTFETGPMKIKVNEENEERKRVREFLDNLKKKEEENKDLIREAGWNNHPFPEMLELPETKHLYRRIRSELNKYENKDHYCQLLQNNKIPCYYKLVWQLSDNISRRNSVYIPLNFSKGEDSYLNIFQHAIMLCPPHEVQSTFEHLLEEYNSLELIDSKEETKNKEEEIQHDFHKSLRQTDALGNGHAESIVHSLMTLSDVPHKAIKAIFSHLKDEI